MLGVDSGSKFYVPARQGAMALWEAVEIAKWAPTIRSTQIGIPEHLRISPMRCPTGAIFKRMLWKCVGQVSEVRSQGG
jgi:hypothetical protein